MSADTTGFCRGGKHDRCDGVLHIGTGYHWWCVCPCHPEPKIHDAQRVDFQRAHAVWEKAARQNGQVTS